MKENEYLCASCHNVYEFEEGWDAEAEAKEIWGIDKSMERVGKDMVIVCDDCFQLMHPSKLPKLWDMAVDELNRSKK